MRTRLVPYTPFGAKRAPLPDALEAQLVTPMGELPTASVHYHRQGVNAVVLDGVTELAYEHWNGASWVEPPNARFLSMTGNFDHLEETPTRNYSFVGIGWMLRRAKVWEPNGLPVDADGKVQFLSANAGTIMATLIQNAKGRGWGAGIQIDFSSTTDSSGQAWAKALTIAYDLELDLEAVLSNLYQQGVCDYRWEGRTLRIFNPETTMARDRTTGSNQVRLVVADGQSSAPEDWTNEDLVTDALVLGDEGKSWTFANNASQPLGRLETVITQGGVSDPGTASLLADQDLLKGSATRISYTREFTVTAGSRVRPFQDYQVGDWVWAQRGTSFERLRVMSLSLTVAPEGLRGHAVLGDRLEDLLTKLAKRTKGITGGASAGGNGTRPAPGGPDTRIPSMPSGLVVGVDSYIDDTGWPAGRVDVDWAHDGNATNGTAMTIDRFQVFYRINEVGRPWAQLLTTSDTEAAYSPLPVFKTDGVTPEQYGFKVRAVAENGKVSEWTPVVAVTMEDDTTPPPVPEFLASHLTTWLRTITVRVSGNESAPSAIQSVTPAANVDLSELTEQIDAGQVKIENSDQMLLNTGVTLGEKLSSNDGLIDEALRGLPEISLSAPTPADGVERPVGALWQQINAAGAQIGFFRWDGAAWVAMPLDPVVVPKIQIGSGTAGQMDISRLTASAAEIETVVIDELWADFSRFKSVATDMLRVGNGNLILDPGFVSSRNRDMRLALSSSQINPVFTQQVNGFYYMRANSVAATTTNYYLSLRPGPVASGQMISVTPESSTPWKWRCGRTAAPHGSRSWTCCTATDPPARWWSLPSSLVGLAAIS